MDQGCPLSLAFFAPGLAGALDAINARLRQGTPGAREFAYLGDVVIVVPAALADEAHQVVCEELGAAGLTINADKTAVWTPRPATQLPQTWSPSGRLASAAWVLSPPGSTPRTRWPACLFTATQTVTLRSGRPSAL